MAYEKLELLVPGSGGKIYISKTLKNGKMSMVRRDMTAEVFTAVGNFVLATTPDKEFTCEFRKNGYSMTVKIENIEEVEDE